MEGVQRPGPRRQAGPDRARPRAPPGPVFAFDEFGPLAIRPIGGSAGRRRADPQRLPANYHKLHGVRQFHGCYSVGDDTLWGVVRRQQVRRQHARRAAVDPGRPTRRRADLRDPGQPVRPQGHQRSGRGRTRTGSSCASPRPTARGRTRSRPHFGPLREFVLNNSNHPNHAVLTRRLHAYLRWRNANARDPDLLAAQRRERARVRSRERPPLGPTRHPSSLNHPREPSWSQH